MRLFWKLLLSTLPLLIVSFLAAGGITYYLARNALQQLAEEWLETRGLEAFRAAEEQAEFLSAYGLDKISASVEQAQSDAWSVISAIDIGEEGYVFIIGGNGTIVHHPDPALIGREVAYEDWFGGEMAGRQSGRLIYRLAGEPSLASFYYFAPWDWYVVAADPLREVHGAVNRIGLWVLVFGSAGAVLIALAQMVLTRRVTAPLAALVDGAERVGRGELDTRIAVETKDEIGLLAGAFNQMTEQLRALYARLQERLSTVVSNAPIILFSLNREGAMTLLEGKGLEALHLTPDRALGRPFAEVFANAPEFAEAARQTLEDGAPVNAYARLEGLVFEVRCNPIRAGNGAIEGVIGVATDVTERDRAERALRRHNEYLAALHTTTLGLISRLDLTELLADLVTRAGELLDTPHGYIYLVREDGSGLERRLGVGVFEQAPGQILSSHEGVAGHVWRSAAPLVVEDYQNWEGRTRSISYSIPIRSIMAVPLKSGAQAVGVLGMAYDAQSEHVFGDEEVELLERFGELASLSLENARLYAAAQEARAAADTASEAKSQFLANVSHELRTPLTAVLGFTRIIQARLAERILPLIETNDKRTQRAIRQVQDNLEIILAEGRRLTTLINNVLDLERIEAGRMEWRMERLAIGEIIEQAADATASLFVNKDVAFEKVVAEGLPPVIGDKDKLVQVVINLISNSVKFTDRGSITCGAERHGGELVIRVVDTGIGIDRHDQPLVFEKFRQVGDTLTDKPKGAGLGLPICKEIVEHHCGRIWVESTLGAGSTFAFALPIAEAATTTGSDQADGRVETEDLEALIRLLEGHDGDRRPTILVADDDASVRTLLRQDLAAEGYRVIEARDGRKTLELAVRKHPDLIILDMLMPEVSGFEVAAALRASPRTMGVPILVLSVLDEKERAFRLGVDRFLAKPLDAGRVLQEAKALLEMATSARKLLVVDDDEVRAERLGAALAGRGHAVNVVPGREEALRVARVERPDLVLAPAELPSRRELMTALRRERGLEALNCVVLT